MTRRTTIAVLAATMGLVAAACGTGETAGDEPAVDVTTYDGSGDADGADAAADDADDADGADNGDTGADGSSPATDEADDSSGGDQSGGSDQDSPRDPNEGTAEGDLAVRIDCPDSILLNEKTVCEIISTGAVAGQWRLPGFLDGPVELTTVPGFNAVFLEPTNAAFVGAWFTMTAEVTGSDGAVATATQNFTIESSSEAATLIDELNALTAASPVNFELGSAVIAPDEAATLEAAAALLMASPGVTIEVGGHTDDVGTREANQALSLARAASVVDYLTGQGVASRQLVPAGYGPTQPIADNGTEQGRATNRRIEFREVGNGPFISIDCPAEFEIGPETRCDIVTANAVEGTWRIDGFTDGDVQLSTIPGTNQIFLQPNNPDFAGERFTIEVSATDSTGRLATATHDFTLVVAN